MIGTTQQAAVATVAAAAAAVSDPVAPMFYQDPAFPPGPLPPAAVRLLLVLLSQALPTHPSAAAAGTATADVALSSDMAVLQSQHAHMELVNMRAVEAAVSVIEQVQALLPGSFKVSPAR